MSRTDTVQQPAVGTEAALLDELREVFSRLDPCPAGLAERIAARLAGKTLPALQAAQSD